MFLGLIGDKASGKSQITNRYIKDEFSEQYLSTIGISITNFETDPPRPYIISIIEFTENEEAFNMFSDNISRIHCFILVFDLSNPNYLDTLEKYLPFLKDKLYIVFGTKSDIVTNSDDIAKEIQEKFHFTHFLIGNSMQGYHIDELFCAAVNLVDSKYTTIDGKLVLRSSQTQQTEKQENKEEELVPTSKCCLLI